MDYLFQLFVLCAFLAVVLLIEGGYLAWNGAKGPEAKKIEQRLRALSAGGHGNSVALLKTRNLSRMPALEAALLRVPRIGVLDRLLVQAGASWNVAGLLLRCAACGIGAGFAAGAMLHWPVWLAGALALAASVLPWVLLLARRRKRLDKLDAQLPEALDLISRAMRAGHAFPGALQMVADECPMPISGEFRMTCDEVNYGIALKDALMNLAARVPSTDLRYFVIAVLIQRETGGNLAELLGNISALIRARFKLLGEIRVLSAEGRLSAWILTVLPFGTGLMLNLVNPGFMSILWQEPMGLKLLRGAAVMMVFGIFAMWRIVKIRV